jgi:peroxiredoxin Q/BCP
MLEPGDETPAVSAQNQHGETVSPDFGEPTVVYFYPKDFTGGCTIEANDFQETLPEFQEAGITVYGVSMDDVGTHADFAEEEGVTFDLLADPDGDAAEAFGVDTSEGYTDRVTFTVVDGEVTGVFDPALADPEGHAEEVLRDLREK